MQKPEYWDDIEAISTKRPTPNYYILKIINATEGTTKENEPILKLELDIIEGEFSNYFTNISTKINKNCLLRSNQLIERKKALPYFKKLINDIESSNMGYKFDFNPVTLRGRKVGAYLNYYYYDSGNGEKKGLRIEKYFSVGEVREELAKELTEKINSNKNNPNDDLPF